MKYDRRKFLRNASAMAAATGFASLPVHFAGVRRARAATDFGPLRPDPMGILDLPEGFSYTVVERAGDAMTDGYRVPAAPDGMACFQDAMGNDVLLINHELTFSGGPFARGQERPAEFYRPEDGLLGGVTRAVLSPSDGALLSNNLVLVGTARNCAGGRTPWGWMTCEEFESTGHGYTFLTRVEDDAVAEPERIDAYGRFYKEALALDPATNAAYMTEDQGVGCLYRFLPADPARPFEGRLQALRVVGMPAFRMADLRRGTTLDIEWIDCPTDDQPTRTMVEDFGCAIFSRGEGIDWGLGAVFVCCTRGGPGESRGQIFEVRTGDDGGTLRVIAESPDRSVFDGPDNIVVTPWGDVMMCEDGDRPFHLRLTDLEGNVTTFGRTLISEFAGACFSLDGRRMFVNIQGGGITLSITGPFPEAMAPPMADAGVPMMGGDAGVPGADGGTPSATPDAGVAAGGAEAASGCRVGGGAPTADAALVIASSLGVAAAASRRRPAGDDRPE